MRVYHRIQFTLLTALGVIGMTAGNLQADNADIAAVGAKILQDHSDSVVHVQAVVTSRGRERLVETFGTVFDDKGTVIIANSAFRTDDFKNVKYVMADGTEVPAKVSVKDPDLDLAFLQPISEKIEDLGVTFTPLPFSKTEVELEGADPLIILAREGKDFRRRATLKSGRVVTTIDTPRRYYRTDVRPAGSPAFNAKGKLVGIFVRRVDDGKPHHRCILPSPNVLKSSLQLAGDSLIAAVDKASDPGALAASMLSATANEIIDKHQDSLVNVTIVAALTVSMGGNSQGGEQELPMIGTVIRKDGLTVVGDPTKQAIQQVKAMVGGADVDIKIEVKSVRLTVADGTEIPAKLIYQDTDLDLGFILPDKDSEEAADLEFAPVLLKEETTASPFEQVIGISRLAPDLNRQVAVRVSRIQTVVNKPRKFYRSNFNGMGFPVFNTKGETIGIQSPHAKSGEAIILPSKTILKAAEEASADGGKKEESEDGKEEEN